MKTIMQKFQNNLNEQGVVRYKEKPPKIKKVLDNLIKSGTIITFSKVEQVLGHELNNDEKMICQSILQKCPGISIRYRKNEQTGKLETLFVS
ncbi:hypothetical protein ACFC3P_12270 [Enterococcus thailandicus]|uniref:hypothetical protein n=1 Tax=Enterococcus thailandicus TaxID=417368 RepID=UPI0035DEB5A6